MITPTTVIVEVDDDVPAVACSCTPPSLGVDIIYAYINTPQQEAGTTLASLNDVQAWLDANLGHTGYLVRLDGVQSFSSSDSYTGNSLVRFEGVSAASEIQFLYTPSASAQSILFATNDSNFYNLKIGWSPAISDFNANLTIGGIASDYCKVIFDFSDSRTTLDGSNGADGIDDSFPNRNGGNGGAGENSIGIVNVKGLINCGTITIITNFTGGTGGIGGNGGSFTTDAITGGIGGNGGAGGRYFWRFNFDAVLNGVVYNASCNILTGNGGNGGNGGGGGSGIFPDNGGAGGAAGSGGSSGSVLMISTINRTVLSSVSFASSNFESGTGGDTGIGGAGQNGGAGGDMRVGGSSGKTEKVVTINQSIDSSISINEKVFSGDGGSSFDGIDGTLSHGLNNPNGKGGGGGSGGNTGEAKYNLNLFKSISGGVNGSVSCFLDIKSGQTQSGKIAGNGLSGSESGAAGESGANGASGGNGGFGGFTFGCNTNVSIGSFSDMVFDIEINSLANALSNGGNGGSSGDGKSGKDGDPLGVIIGGFGGQSGIGGVGGSSGGANSIVVLKIDNSLSIAKFKNNTFNFTTNISSICGDAGDNGMASNGGDGGNGATPAGGGNQNGGNGGNAGDANFELNCGKGGIAISSLTFDIDVDVIIDCNILVNALIDSSSGDGGAQPIGNGNGGDGGNGAVGTGIGSDGSGGDGGDGAGNNTSGDGGNATSFCSIDIFSKIIINSSILSSGISVITPSVGIAGQIAVVGSGGLGGSPGGVNGAVGFPAFIGSNGLSIITEDYGQEDITALPVPPAWTIKNLTNTLFPTPYNQVGTDIFIDTAGAVDGDGDSFPNAVTPTEFLSRSQGYIYANWQVQGAGLITLHNGASLRSSADVADVYAITGTGNPNIKVPDNGINMSLFLAVIENAISRYMPVEDCEFKRIVSQSTDMLNCLIINALSGLQDCNNVVNVDAQAGIKADIISCGLVTDCDIEGEFLSCTTLLNCTSTDSSKDGFEWCNGVDGCIADGAAGAGFKTCNNLTNNNAINNTDCGFIGNTNIGAGNTESGNGGALCDVI